MGQYADDTELFLDGSESSLMKTLFNFYKISGLKINIDKTKAVWIGAMAGSRITLSHDFKLDWHNGNFDVLGIKLNALLENLWVINTKKRLEHIKRILFNWKRRNLTLIGKITVIKSLALSTIVHILSAL